MQSKQDQILISRVCETLSRGRATQFLDQREQSLVDPVLRKRKIIYQKYCYYVGCEKVMYYVEQEPSVCCFKILSPVSLSHSEVLGSLFGLQIARDVFGDIVIQECPYIVVVGKMASYLEQNLCMIGKQYVVLEKVSMEQIADYKKSFLRLECNVASNRLDAVLAKLTGLKRIEIKELIRKKDVLVNQVIIQNECYYLKKQDIFSIRRYGKYRFEGVIRCTKKNRMIVEIMQYQ